MAVKETVATRAREMAQRIERLPAEIVQSFKSTAPNRRKERLRSIGTEILIGMAPVLSWLERHRHPGTSELVRRRLQFVVDEAEQCAGLEIPEYAGGTVVRRDGTESISEGMTRTATLVVPAKMLAATLMDWANDIEAYPSTAPKNTTDSAGIAQSSAIPKGSENRNNRDTDDGSQSKVKAGQQWIRLGPVGLRFNTNAHTVARKGKVANFQGNGRVWEVLMKLARRHPAWYQTLDLGRDVWNPANRDIDPNENTVQQAITALRRLLLPVGVTVEHARKIGYRLAECRNSVAGSKIKKKRGRKVRRPRKS
jgi:hypothetical protein